MTNKIKRALNAAEDSGMVGAKILKTANTGPTMAPMPETMFDHFPFDAVCPLCGMSHDGRTILIPIDGTETEEGGRAQPAHVQCLVNCARGLRINPAVDIVYWRTAPMYQQWKTKKPAPEAPAADTTNKPTERTADDE